MSEESTTESETETDAPDATAADSGASSIEKRFEGRDAREYLLKGALVILTLFAVFAAFRFYSSASTAINVWVADEYRSLFQAGFNLVVLLVAGIGISLVVRELTD